MKLKIGKIFLFFLLMIFAFPVNAQTNNLQRAKVLEVISEEQKIILQEIDKNIETINQTLSAEIIDGEEESKKITLENDYIKLERGDIFFVEKTSSPSEADRYTVRERDRQFPIVVLMLIFMTAIIIFGGRQGIRSLISLAGSFFVIIYLLLPMLTKGYSPILVSVSLATVILFIAIYFTHGFNKESTAAFSGTIIAIILTGLLAIFSVFIMQLTGFDSEESIFLNVDSAVKLNFHGLLLGGILIGVLGILDDIAVTQAAVVSEIYQSAGHLTRREVFKKAIRVGREHVSALVNTLVLAYAGASLPLLLLISNYDYPIRFVLSQELFATEIVRTIVGSIGLVLTVPITTLLAVFLLKGYKGKNASGGHGHVNQ